MMPLLTIEGVHGTTLFAKSFGLTAIAHSSTSGPPAAGQVEARAATECQGRAVVQGDRERVGVDG
jgi:hypothetical protein